MGMAGLRSRGLAVVSTAVLVAALAPVSFARLALAADDVTPPVGAVTINDGDVWSNSPSEFWVDFAATDDLSGVATFEYRSNGGAWLTRTYIPSRTAIWMQIQDWDQGVNTVEARWTDVAGNTSAIAADTIRIDNITPSATVELYHYTSSTITVDLVASDTNGIAGVWFSCDGGSTFVQRPFAARVTIATGAAGLDCRTYGPTEVLVEVRDPAGNANRRVVYPDIYADITFETPLPAVTGRPFTIAPRMPDDFMVSADGSCTYSLRWGTDKALGGDIFDDSFGSIMFQLPPTSGKCKPWTFTLPWVPYPQFEGGFEVVTNQGGQLVNPPGDQRRFMATVESTERLIAESNLPFVQVLPSTYTPTVGRPITYTRYPIGGAVPCCGARWSAYQGEGNNPNHWRQTGGATFTVTPFETGNILVVWDQANSPRLLQALYDPPVKPPDKSKPNTTTPIHQFTPGSSGTHVPVKVSWSGTDKGWGIKWYRLERSINGGAWTKVTLPTGTTTSIRQDLPPGSSVRFRVRAIDKVGNVGSWDYGRTFRVDRIADTSPLIAYNAGWIRVTDATAAGGLLHETTTSGSAAYLRFTGSDVAWITEMGPSRGKAKVYIDGAYHSTVDLTAASWSPRRLVFRQHFSSVAVHTIRIEAIGTAGRPTIGLDGFATLR